VTNNLTMRWIPVADATGRTHLESVWVSVSEAAQTVPSESSEPSETHAA